MSKISYWMVALCCLGMPVQLYAQQGEQTPHTDSYYLVGAVPEEQGKVVFSRTLQVHSMSQEEIFQRVTQWMEQRLSQNKNHSRVVYTNTEKGQVVGYGEEWLVFRSTALSLDRTKIQYQLQVSCHPKQCVLQVEKIRFEYREGEEKYTAEEWITDKYALNKSKTKLVRGLAKWRRKTVDFVDELENGLADALQVQRPSTKENVTIQPMIPLQPATHVKKTTEEYREIDPDALPQDVIQMGTGKLVLVIGKDEFDQTVMTARAGGSLGKMSDKPVIFSFLAPDQPYQAMENTEYYTVRFYPTGQQQPSVILQCRKLPTQAPMEGQPRMFVGEILQAKVK